MLESGGLAVRASPPWLYRERAAQRLAANQEPRSMGPPDCRDAAVPALDDLCVSAAIQDLAARARRNGHGVELRIERGLGGGSQDPARLVGVTAASVRSWPAGSQHSRGAETIAVVSAARVVHGCSAWNRAGFGWQLAFGGYMVGVEALGDGRSE
jgi:hypothetical protein